MGLALVSNLPLSWHCAIWVVLLYCFASLVLQADDTRVDTHLIHLSFRLQVVNKLIVDAFELSVFSTYAVWVSRFLDECHKGAEPWCKDLGERESLMEAAVAVIYEAYSS